MEAEQAGKLSDQLKPQAVGTAHLQGTAENSNEVPEQTFTVETGPRTKDQTHLDSSFLQQIQNCICMHILHPQSTCKSLFMDLWH